MTRDKIIADAKGITRPMLTVMAVDDDGLVGQLMERYLAEIECELSVYDDPARCLEAFHAKPADIVITDLSMPGMDGLAVLRDVKARHPATEVIIITGLADKDAAIQALKLGAFDFFEKPIHGDELVETVKRTARYQTALRERDQLAEQLEYLSSQEAKRWGIDAFVGQSKAVRKILHDIRLLQKAANTPVLITGESGTGKELVARAIHYGGTRNGRPFIPVNCSAIPKDLAESDFFGHVRGAFTGAATGRKGHFELAHGGTLFLDEIGDMPPALQAKLLRTLEDGLVTPVGGTAAQKVDVRVVAATNRDLREAIAAGGFRADLYFRLAAFTLEIPPLRERPEDILPLVKYFLRKLASEMGLMEPALTAEAAPVLEAYNYQGNVRELKNLIERALLESRGKAIMPAHLHFLNLPVAGVGATPPPASVPPAPVPAVGAGPDLPVNLKEAEALVIQRALQQADGNMSTAARLLGINRTKLYRKISRQGT